MTQHDKGPIFVSPDQLEQDVAHTLRRLGELRAGDRPFVVDSTGLRDSDADDGYTPIVVGLEELDDGYEDIYRDRWAGTIAVLEGRDLSAGQ